MGVPTRRIHHPITPLPPALRALLVTFLSPPTFWRLPRVYRRLQPAPLNLSCCLSTTSCLAADSNSVLTLVEICRFALALGWLVLYVPSSFLAEFQKLISSKRLAWLLRLVSMRAKKEQHMPLPISIMDSRVWEEGKGGWSGVGQGNSSNSSS